MRGSVLLRRSWVVLALLLFGGSRLGQEHALRRDDEARRGFELVARLGCGNCHAGGPPSPPAPRLGSIGARRTPRAIRTALAVHSPDCLVGMTVGRRSGIETQTSKEDLTHFLVSRGGPIRQPPQPLEAGALERGRQLYHGVGCVACHAPYEDAATLARPLWDFPEAFEARADGAADARADDPTALRALARSTTLAALAAYLVDPLAFHPDGRMPSLALEAHEAADLAAYLWYEEALETGAALRRGRGLVLEYFEASFDGETADFDALRPLRTEVATTFFDGIARREEDFGFRFRGFVEAPRAGPYAFSTTSDDGSMLYVDGKLVVDNRGQHAMDERTGEVHLEAGPHAFEVTYFEHLGGDGLEVAWSGPGFEKQELCFEALSHLEVELAGTDTEPFQLDAARAERGRASFSALGCAACHPLDGVANTLAAPAFAALDAERGCLAPNPVPGAPRFVSAQGERESLQAAVRAGTAPVATLEERLARELARLDCGACHERGELAGPGDERRSYFQVERGLDLGDEGRLPPRLDGVGAKLKPAWLRAILVEGGRARPYMKTRMPQFGAANVEPLVELFAEVDAPERDEREPEFSLEAVEAGKLLAGTQGLGCIQCHDFAGHPSIGIPAVDLATVHERIYPGWFRALLMDPVGLKMNTRMPEFWVGGKSPVKTLYDADPARQVDALWTYLSLGSSMPLPSGLVPLEGEYEVEVFDTPVCVGVFMEGVSPRTIAVGLPERVHYAFDVQNSRLALAWRGRFLDARGTWHGRAGQLEEPAGEDVLEFPSGPTFAVLEHPEDPWPGSTEVASACRTLGRSVDEARRPVFRYGLGCFTMDESPTAVLQPGSAALERVLRIRSYRGPEDTGQLYLRLAVGEGIQREDERTWAVERPRMRIGNLPTTSFVFTGDGVSELRVPVGFGTAKASTSTGTECVGWSHYEIRYSW